jgi:hypothetical protein
MIVVGPSFQLGQARTNEFICTAQTIKMREQSRMNQHHFCGFPFIARK